MKSCAYCGIEAGTTRDHVFPECLFTKPYPNNMITVPACLDCNKDKKLSDEYVRDMLISDYRTWNSPAFDMQKVDKVIRSVQSRRSLAITPRTFATMERVDRVTDSGIYLGKINKLTLDKDRVHTAFRRMAKGLFYYQTKRYLHEEAVVDGRLISGNQIDVLMHILKSDFNDNLHERGEVVSYLYITLNETSPAIVIVMCFYSAIWYYATIMGPGVVDEAMSLL